MASTRPPRRSALAAVHKQGRSFHKLCVFSILIGFIFLTTGGLRGAPEDVSGVARGEQGGWIEIVKRPQFGFLPSLRILLTAKVCAWGLI